ASVIAGALWDAAGSQATFLAGAAFAAVAAGGLLPLRGRLAALRRRETIGATRAHRMFNFSGTLKAEPGPGTSAGGGGNGWARRPVASASWSSAAEPELWLIALDNTRPARSIVKASCTTPLSPCARASSG